MKKAISCICGKLLNGNRVINKCKRSPSAKTTTRSQIVSPLPLIPVSSRHNFLTKLAQKWLHSSRLLALSWLQPWSACFYGACRQPTNLTHICPWTTLRTMMTCSSSEYTAQFKTSLFNKLSLKSQVMILKKNTEISSDLTSSPWKQSKVQVSMPLEFT